MNAMMLNFIDEDNNISILRITGHEASILNIDVGEPLVLYREESSYSYKILYKQYSFYESPKMNPYNVSVIIDIWVKQGA